MLNILKEIGLVFKFFFIEIPGKIANQPLGIIDDKEDLLNIIGILVVTTSLIVALIKQWWNSRD